MKKLIPVLTAAALVTSTVNAQDFSGTLKTGIATDYVAKPGFVVGDGPVNQDLLALNYGPFSNFLGTGNDWNISAFVWANTDLNDGALNEIDTGFYASSSFFVENLKARFGLEEWLYPSIPGASNDTVFRVGINYNDIFNADAEFTYLLTGASKNGKMLYTSLSKPFRLHDKNVQVHLTPTLDLAITDDFFNTDGVQHVTPGLSLNVGKGPLSLEGFIKKQFGTGNGIPNSLYGGVNARITYIF